MTANQTAGDDGLIGTIYGVKILPETKEQWLELLDEEVTKALAAQLRELKQHRDLMSDSLNRDRVTEQFIDSALQKLGGSDE